MKRTFIPGDVVKIKGNIEVLKKMIVDPKGIKFLTQTGKLVDPKYIKPLKH